MESVFPNLDETVVATARYLDTVTAMADEELRAPSLLPGWSRAHVVTHVARNADALSNVLRGAQAGEVRPMYESRDRRDADIEAGAQRSAEELREDAVASAGRWHQAANEVHAANLEALGCSTPGSDTWPVRRVGMLRRIEVEVHHADLGVAYSAEDWPADFVSALMKRRQRELSESGPPFRWWASDTGESWSSGDGPQVTGRAAELLWWLLGRGSGTGLHSSHGSLPRIGRWT